MIDLRSPFQGIEIEPNRVLRLHRNIFVKSLDIVAQMQNHYSVVLPDQIGKIDCVPKIQKKFA